MFHQIDLINTNDNESITFDKLVNKINFESVAKGRFGTNLFYSNSEQIPLVRSTSIYSTPIQKFNLVHLDIINKIKSIANIQLKLDIKELNNGLVEIYTNEYKTMGYHSDQILDLDSNSFICIYSFYSNPESKSMRNLEILNKKTGEKNVICLGHNSVVIFDLETNQSHLHKIVLDEKTKTNMDIKQENKWFGLTLRTSKTFIDFTDSKPYLIDKKFANTKTEMKLATQEEKKIFYKLRSEENKSICYEYPFISYTISPSDLIKPL